MQTDKPLSRSCHDAVESAVDWSLLHGLAMKSGTASADHCAFSLAPMPIARERFHQLRQVVPLMGRMINAVSNDHDFLSEAIEPLQGSDCLFDHLYEQYQTLHTEGQAPARKSLLIMRTDFMDDEQLGPKIIEFNGIAAGMGPFGQRAHQLHQYLQETQAEEFHLWAGSDSVDLVANAAIENLASGVAAAARKVREDSQESGAPVFMIVVQPDEDNVYDQKLLKLALQARGIKTVRRTLRRLYDDLSTGDNNRLQLAGIGSIDAVYYRTGYQAEDYVAHDVEESRCCEALGTTRAFIEEHNVAVNATVAQQLATSKRVQMLLTEMPAKELTRFGLTLEEAEKVKFYLGEMRGLNEQSLDWFKQQSNRDWVLKNQGEGGGHCIFDEDILPKLETLAQQPESHDSWALMRRLRPKHRPHEALLVRKGEAYVVDDLVSEIGMFTVHFEGEPVTENNGYAGYLIRSKPAEVQEGGVHSGLGVVDSLYYAS